MFGFRSRKRARLRRTPLPAQWWAYIERNVPYIRRLNAQDQAELGGIVQVLLDEKHFEGCGGLEMTDEIRVTIAAQAAVLLLHRDTGYYPTLRSILVYPRAYLASGKRALPDGSITEDPQARLGESWFRGSLVLSWCDVVKGARDPNDGHNVVFHEFAHQLDGESGVMNGAPSLEGPAGYSAWARVLGEEFRGLTAAVHRGDQSLIDAYGATNPAEFFAVVTETFFERPDDLRNRHPELYAEFARFYHQDPAAAEMRAAAS